MKTVPQKILNIFCTKSLKWLHRLPTLAITYSILNDSRSVRSQNKSRCSLRKGLESINGKVLVIEHNVSAHL